MGGEIKPAERARGERDARPSPAAGVCMGMEAGARAGGNAPRAGAGAGAAPPAPGAEGAPRAGPLTRGRQGTHGTPAAWTLSTFL